MPLFIASTLALLVLALRSDLNPLEIIGIAVAACVALVSPKFANRKFRAVERWLVELARHRTRTVLLVGALAILLRLAILPAVPVPEPVIVDEFSHLLLADTLLLGRVTNPTPPMWAHMETMHVIQKPTYTSMYLPGQGLFLALGKFVTGFAWAGVLLSVALMCMAICWALQGWLPPGWALLGGLIAIGRFGLFSYWINSYWGSALGALGGALVIGAWPRIRDRMSIWPAVLMGFGIALLTISRPFEGAVVCAPVAFALLWWLARLEAARRLAAVRAVVPIVCLLAVTAGLLAYYNWRVTGNPVYLPYNVNQRTYGWPTTLPWFSIQPHTHTVKAMHDYYLWEVEEHQKLVNFRENVFRNVLDVVFLWTFFAGPALTVFLIFLPYSLRDKRVRLPAVVLLAGVLAVAMEQSRYPHYFAPAAAAYLIVLLQSARHMRAIGARKRPSLMAMCRYIPVIVLMTLAARSALPASRTRDGAAGSYTSWYTSWCCGRTGGLDRGRILDQLNRIPGSHLVIVRYGSKHEFLYEWVHNDPDIDHAKVVWAREMGAERDQELLDYFRGRSVWLLTVNDDSKPPDLLPYPAPTQNVSAQNQPAR